MNTRIFFIFTLYFVLMAAQAGNGQVVLNEIMSSNRETIRDEDGDYPDWIELYNAGPTPENVSGYGLSDDYENPFRWKLPDVSLEPGEFLFIWASGKDRRNPHQPLHTNFSIQAAGEEILLSHPDGGRMDEIPPTPIPSDISLGRRPDGSDDWYFFEQPTPGEPNLTEGFQHVLDPPIFSQTAGLYTADFALTLSSPAPSAVIRYTLDGSEPTSESPRYTEPIPISNRAGDPNDLSEIRTSYNTATWKTPEDEVFKANVVRARAFAPGAIASGTVTNTYFVAPDIDTRYSLPLISVATDRDALFDHNYGIYVPGAYHQTNNAWTGNYFQRGRHWERPISIEMLEPDGTVAFSQNAGLRIHGGFSRAVPYKTLRIYARRDYDTEDWINYQIFPDRPLNRFKRILLRNSGNDWGGHPWATYNNSEPGTLFRDAMMQRLVEHLNFDTQGYRPAIVFINGEYWGIHNFRQRYDRYYFLTNYGIEQEELDLLTRNSEVKHGSTVHYDGMMSYVASSDMSDASTLRHLKTLMDVDNFLEYYIANIYFDNTDWPHNNIDFWRYRRDEFNPGALPGRDGRWRWMMFDTDFGFGLGGDHNPGAGYRRNTMAHAVRIGNNSWSTRLFRKLLENDSFKHEFVNRFADHLNTTFTGERVASVINAMQDSIAPEMPEHLRRWRYPRSVETWDANVDVMRTFGFERPRFATQHVMQQFSIPGTWDVTVDLSDPAAGYVQINRLRITPETPGVPSDPYPWTGTYFQQIPLSVAAVPAPGYRFTRWEGVDTDHESSSLAITRQDAQSLSLIAVFEPHDGDPMHPIPHDLSKAPYSFTTWRSDQPAHTYPPNMVFQQTSTVDPGLDDEMESLWMQPYDLENRSRILGLGDFGIAFINTANPQDIEGAGYVGAAVVALNTEDVDSIFVTWTGATPRPNSRAYNLRLQYRTGMEGPFRDVTDDDGNPVEYKRSPQAGHTRKVGPHLLPAETAGQSYVQLRWKYYFSGDRLYDESGQRSMLRLSDITIATSPVPMENEGELPASDQLELYQNFPNPFKSDTRLEFSLPDDDHVRLAVYDVLGREVAVLTDGVMQAGRHSIEWNAGAYPSGTYFYRIETRHARATRRMTVLR